MESLGVGKDPGSLGFARDDTKIRRAEINDTSSDDCTKRKAILLRK
jgi:hypothetical protein